MTLTEFVELMSRLRAHYQNAIADQDLWEASVMEYWRDLQNYDSTSIRKAFADAWKAYVVWMPSCGQILELIEMHEKTRAVHESRQLTEGEQFSDPDAAERARRIIASLAGSKSIDEKGGGHV